MDALIIGLALSADCFSAALALGFKPHTNKDSLKFAGASASAVTLMTLGGAIAGREIVAKFSAIDHWVAFTLLFSVALFMIVDVVKELRGLKKEEDPEDLDFHHFFKIFLVTIATSLDGLGVGVGLGVMGSSILPYLISASLSAFSATLFGLYLARRAPKKLGPLFTLLGAIVLMLLAFKMLSI